MERNSLLSLLICYVQDFHSLIYLIVYSRFLIVLLVVVVVVIVVVVVVVVIVVVVEYI